MYRTQFHDHRKIPNNSAARSTFLLPRAIDPAKLTHQGRSLRRVARTGFCADTPLRESSEALDSFRSALRYCVTLVWETMQLGLRAGPGSLGRLWNSKLPTARFLGSPPLIGVLN